MSIVVNCACGKRIRASAELAGKRIRCLACKQTLVVPSPPGHADVSESAASTWWMAAAAAPRPSGPRPTYATQH